MSMRLRFVLIGLGCLAVTAVWFLVIFRPNQSHLSVVRKDVVAAKVQVDSLRTQLAHLQALKREEPTLRATLERFSEALPADPHIPDFILRIQDAANAAGIRFLSITPSLPAPVQNVAPVTAAAPSTSAAPTPAPTPAASAAPAAAPAQPATNIGLQEIGISINTSGSYFAIESFIYKLEHLGRAITIDNFALSGGGQSTGAAAPSPSGLSVSLKMRVFSLPAGAA